MIKPFPARHSTLQTSRHNHRRRLMRRTPTTRSRSPPRRGSAPPPFCSVSRATHRGAPHRGDAARARVDTAFPLAPSSLRVRLGASLLRRTLRRHRRPQPTRTVVATCRPIVQPTGIHRRSTCRRSCPANGLCGDHLRRPCGRDRCPTRDRLVSPCGPTACRNVSPSRRRRGLGPDRLHACHMSLSTAKPLWPTHPTHLKVQGQIVVT